MIKRKCVYFKQPRPIPEEATAYHGITDEMCKNMGVKPEPVLQEFLEDCRMVGAMVAHNADFDFGVIEANMRRFKVTDEFQVPIICTMQESEPILELPTRIQNKAFKAPKLDDLMEYLFISPGLSVQFDRHDAQVDTAITARCFMELKRRGHISL